MKDLFVWKNPTSICILTLTVCIASWHTQYGKVARLICDVYNVDGTPFIGDPRYVLKRVIKKASDMGYAFNVGPEL